MLSKIYTRQKEHHHHIIYLDGKILYVVIYDEYQLYPFMFL